jgi:hypothetical protein
MAELRNYEMGEGKDWNVKDTIAYGRGAVHEDFKGLQRDLNRYAADVGFKKLDVDGFLGPNTVDAWNKIYQAALKRDPAATVAFPPIVMKEQIATLCQHVRHWLQTSGARILGGA